MRFFYSAATGRTVAFLDSGQKLTENQLRPLAKLFILDQDKFVRVLMAAGAKRKDFDDFVGQSRRNLVLTDALRS